MGFENQVKQGWQQLYKLSRPPSEGKSFFHTHERLKAFHQARTQLQRAIDVCNENNIKVSLPRLGPGKGVGPEDLGIKV